MSAPANRLAPTLILVWGIAALLWVQQGMLERVPFPPPVFVGAGVLFLLVSAVVVPGFAAWMKQVDLRVILGLHLVRFVGFYFLWLSSQGRLDPFFANSRGSGTSSPRSGPRSYSSSPPRARESGSSPGTSWGSSTSSSWW